MTQIVITGPFKWSRVDNGGCENWELVLPKSLKVTHFSVKNYGGKPEKHLPFSGWRLVSGGPFEHVGGWTSRDAAMRGVVKFLIEYYRHDAAQKIKEAEAAQRALKKMLKEFDKVSL